MDFETMHLGFYLIASSIFIITSFIQNEFITNYVAGCTFFSEVKENKQERKKFIKGCFCYYSSYALVEFLFLSIIIEGLRLITPLSLFSEKVIFNSVLITFSILILGKNAMLAVAHAVPAFKVTQKVLNKILEYEFRFFVKGPYLSTFIKDKNIPLRIGSKENTRVRVFMSVAGFSLIYKFNEVWSKWREGRSDFVLPMLVTSLRWSLHRIEEFRLDRIISHPIKNVLFMVDILLQLTLLYSSVFVKQHLTFPPYSNMGKDALEIFPFYICVNANGQEALIEMKDLLIDLKRGETLDEMLKKGRGLYLTRGVRNLILIPIYLQLNEMGARDNEMLDKFFSRYKSV